VKAPFGRDVIETIIPHRDPFLFLDEVIELEPGKRVVARKRVRPDEWFFPGHFPGRPIMPGVIMVEALAQAGAVAVLSLEENRGKLALFAGIDDVRFKRIVEPGDELTLTCEVEAVRGPIGKGRVEARVGDELVPCHLLVELTDRPGEAGTRRRERLEAERFEQPCRAEIPGIGDDEQPVAGVQLSEPGAAIGDGHDAILYQSPGSDPGRTRPGSRVKRERELASVADPVPTSCN